jgi:hypothetical protein
MKHSPSLLFYAQNSKTTDMAEKEQWDEIGENNDMFPKAEPHITRDDK